MWSNGARGGHKAAWNNIVNLSVDVLLLLDGLAGDADDVDDDDTGDADTGNGDDDTGDDDTGDVDDDTGDAVDDVDT